MHSDGGTRRGKCSSSGWVAELTILDKGIWVRRKLAQSGNFFNHPVSLFTAESFGLYEALLFIERLVA